jgi:hypothetical protein
LGVEGLPVVSRFLPFLHLMVISFSAVSNFLSAYIHTTLEWHSALATLGAPPPRTVYMPADSHRILLIKVPGSHFTRSRILSPRLLLRAARTPCSASLNPPNLRSRTHTLRVFALPLHPFALSRYSSRARTTKTTHERLTRARATCIHSFFRPRIFMIPASRPWTLAWTDLPVSGARSHTFVTIYK